MSFKFRATAARPEEVAGIINRMARESKERLWSDYLRATFPTAFDVAVDESAETR